MVFGGLRPRGKRHNWYSGEASPEPATLGRERVVMGFRMVNGKRESIGVMTTSHPSISGTSATPRQKRRTIPHNKGTAFPGQWKQAVVSGS